MLQIAIGRYGAIELKMAYQRNMALAMLMIITVTAIIVGLMYLMAGEPPIQLPPADFDKGIIDLGISPTVLKPPPDVRSGGGRRSALPGTVSSNLVPINDDEFLDYNEGSIYTRDELYAIVNGQGLGEGNFDGDIVIDAGRGGGGYLADERPADFVSCEIYPELIYSVEPVYPRQARIAGLTAIVWVNIHVGENGEALEANVYVSSGSNAGFDEAALIAAMKCKFKPGIQNGRPAKVWITLKFAFDLNE